MSRGLPTLTYLAAGLPLGIVWFTLLVSGFSLGLGLFVTVVGVFVLAATWELARAMTGLEARLAHGLLGARTAPLEPVPGLAPKARSAAGWRAIGFLFARFLAGVPLASLTLGLVLGGASYVVAPLWFWAVPGGIDIGLFSADTLPEAVLLVLPGLVAAALGLWLADALTTPLRHLAEWGMPADRVVARQDGRQVRERRETHPVDWPWVLRAIGRVAGAIVAVLLVIWLATGLGYPWFLWPAIAFSIPAGIAAIGVLKDRFPAGPRRRSAVLGMLAGLLLGFETLVWAMSGFGYFWPIWSALALAILFGIRHVLPERASRELRERLARVEASRAAGVEARDDELGRIERDLHDGAQARLVAVAMGLGRAEERMSADPDRARELMLEAQEHAHAAIKELRDLARGIAPPVLADRGLVAAVRALAATSPVDVVVRDRLGGERPPAPAERTAYFVVAEAITNAAKHVGPEATVIVDLDAGKHRLEVRVLDDGPGGAAADGSGLRGLAQRVEAVDGTFSVESEPAQGTLIRTSIPWPGAGRAGSIG